MRINEDSIYRDALEIFGKSSRLSITQEECGELIQAISKIFREGNTENNVKKLLEEIADVRIMTDQLIKIYCPNNFDDIKQQKLDKLNSYVQNGMILG